MPLVLPVLRSFILPPLGRLGFAGPESPFMKPGGGDAPQSASNWTGCFFSKVLGCRRELRSPFRRSDGMSSILGVRRISLVILLSRLPVRFQGEQSPRSLRYILRVAYLGYKLGCSGRPSIHFFRFSVTRANRGQKSMCRMHQRLQPSTPKRMSSCPRLTDQVKRTA